jgi:hypothetical protein
MLSGYQSAINTKQATITLTTTGTSGAATFSSNTLNIPQYQAAGTYVTSVTGTSPIVSSGGTTPAISIPAATSLVNGYLSSTDWSTFNGKESVLTFSSPLVRTTNTISIPAATTSVNGYLSSADWTTFNNKYNLPSLTSGSVLFSNGTTIAQDNSNFFWDDTNNRLGIGTASPTGRLMLYQSSAGNVLQNIVSNQGGSTQAGINFSPSMTDAEVAANPAQASIYATDSNYGANIIFATKATGAVGNALTPRLTIASTGAATFSSSVTGTQFNAFNDRNFLARGSFRLTSPTNNASALDISVGDNTTYINGNYYGGGNDNTIIIGTYANLSNQLVLKPSGNVGIGTTTPTGKLHSYIGDITAGNAPASSGTTPVNAMLNLTNNRGVGMFFGGSYAGNYGQWIQVSDVGNLGVYYPLYLNPNGGNVLIGTTTNAGYTLDVNGTGRFGASTYKMLSVSDAGGAGWATTGGASTAPQIYMYNTGTSAIVQTYINNTARLEVTNTGISVTGAATFSSLGTGTVYSNSGTLTNTNPSDSSLKNSIKPLSYGLTEILQLQPKAFYYNSDTAKSSLKYGFVAQDVQPIMPDIVRPIGNESDKLGLESDGIYVTMVNAIKELSAQIEILKSEIQTLKNK